MWPSYLINLADNSDRLSRCATQFDAQGITFERIDAVNGWEMSDAEIADVYDVKANRIKAKHPLVRPEIGCYLSHIRAWEAIANGVAPGGFIFEDDFKAEQTMASALELLTHDDGWDMVKLFSLNPDTDLLNPRKLGNDFTIGIPYRVPTCLIAYGLTKEAAQKLVKTAYPIVRPVDEDQKFFWETGLRVALVTPQPISVGDQQAVTGTIGQSRRNDNPIARSRGSFAQKLHGIRYQLAYKRALKKHRKMGTGL